MSQDEALQNRAEAVISEASRLHAGLGDRIGDLINIARVVTDALSSGNKVLLMGNGGSAAEAQHIATEFVCRVRRDRKPLPAIALTTDTSLLTAVSNDYSFEDVFVRQVEALCNAGDVVVGLSGSGNSENVVRALVKARELGATTVACTGRAPNRMIEAAELGIAIPTDETARAQEVQLTAWHLICELVDDLVLGSDL